jgi:hypothetical protein
MAELSRFLHDLEGRDPRRQAVGRQPRLERLRGRAILLTCLIAARQRACPACAVLVSIQADRS